VLHAVNVIHPHVPLVACFFYFPGIQSFWATTFKNVELLNGMIQEHDEPVLDSLMNVQLELNSDPMVS